MINVSEKFMELLTPVIDELGIRETDKFQEICDKLMKNRIFKKITTRNIVKEELFEDMHDLSMKLKYEILESIPSISKLPIREFSNACDKLPKVFVDLSNACTKKYYAFEMELDENNNEYLVIFDKETNSKIVSVHCISLKKLINDIINAMNNDVFHLPEKNVTFTLYTPNEEDKERATSELNLEEMMEILNHYIIAINSKFSKVLSKKFIFKVEEDDSTNLKDYEEKHPSKKLILPKASSFPINFDSVPITSESTYTTPAFNITKDNNGFTKLNDIE
jgi:hypothetical protein